MLTSPIGLLLMTQSDKFGRSMEGSQGRKVKSERLKARGVRAESSMSFDYLRCRPNSICPVRHAVDSKHQNLYIETRRSQERAPPVIYASKLPDKMHGSNPHVIPSQRREGFNPVINLLLQHQNLPLLLALPKVLQEVLHTAR